MTSNQPLGLQNLPVDVVDIIRDHMNNITLMIFDMAIDNTPQRDISGHELETARIDQQEFEKEQNDTYYDNLYDDGYDYDGYDGYDYDGYDGYDYDGYDDVDLYNDERFY